MVKSNSYIDWLSNHLFACPFKTYSGFDCPGCGFQRSVLALFRGDVQASFKLYPAAIPIILLAAFTLIHLKYDFKIGSLIIRATFLGVAIIVFINYIYKIYTHQLIS